MIDSVSRGGWWRWLLYGLGLYLLVAVVLGMYWSLQPDHFDPREKAADYATAVGGEVVTGSVWPQRGASADAHNTCSPMASFQETVQGNLGSIHSTGNCFSPGFDSYFFCSVVKLCDDCKYVIHDGFVADEYYVLFGLHISSPF